MRPMWPGLLTIAVASVLALGACGDDDGGGGSGDGGGTTSTSADSTPAGMANPASAFCESQGGTVSIVTDAYGGSQRGMCELPDGTVVDEWEYYRAYHTEGEGATLANPAAVYCERQGGTVIGDEPMCELADGTQVDAWDYYREQSAQGG